MVQITASREEVSLLGQYRRASADERRVILWLVDRLMGRGRDTYGPIDVHDGRDWARERDEEVGDLLIYAACESLNRGAGR